MNLNLSRLLSLMLRRCNVLLFALSAIARFSASEKCNHKTCVHLNPCLEKYA